MLVLWQQRGLTQDTSSGDEDLIALLIVCGTLRSWERIQGSGELRRMGRQHIHFASEPKHLRGDDWACVLLQACSVGCC